MSLLGFLVYSKYIHLPHTLHHQSPSIPLSPAYCCSILLFESRSIASTRFIHFPFIYYWHIRQTTFLGERVIASRLSLAMTSIKGYNCLPFLQT